MKDMVGGSRGSVESGSKSSTKEPSKWRWVFRIVLLALYLNVGWAYGTWFHENVDYQTTDTVVEEVAAGAWDIMQASENTPEAEQLSKIVTQIAASILWPFVVITSVGSWLVFGFYKLLWLIFAGGIAKLLGVG